MSFTEWRSNLDPSYYFDYNCSDTSSDNRLPSPWCQSILDDFCKMISPYASINSYPPFFNSTYGQIYMNNPVNGSCTSVFESQLYNCSAGNLGNNISKNCETTKSNYCNVTSEFIQQNQILHGQLNSLNDSNYKNIILSNCLIGSATFSAFLTSAYLATKYYYKCLYSNSENPIVLDDALFKDHALNLKHEFEELIDFLDSKTEAKFSELSTQLTKIHYHLNIQKLDELLPTLKKHADYYTDILRLKSFTYGVMGLGLFRVQPEIAMKVVNTFKKISSLGFDEDITEKKTLEI